MATKATTKTETTETTIQPLDDATRAKLEQAGYTVVRKAQREPKAPRTEKECHDHTTNFPDEEVVRPIAEFGVATGSACKRCYKLEQGAKRVEFRKEHPTIQQWADELANYVEALTIGWQLNEEEPATQRGGTCTSYSVAGTRSAQRAMRQTAKCGSPNRDPHTCRPAGLDVTQIVVTYCRQRERD